MKHTENKNDAPEIEIQSFGAIIPEQLSEVTAYALRKLQEALHGDVAGYVANRLNQSPEELAFALAGEVEARNICLRHFLSDDERRRTLRTETQDVPDSKQIVKF